MKTLPRIFTIHLAFKEKILSIILVQILMILIKSIAEVRTMLILLRARAELLVVMAAVQRRLSTTCGGERERER